jgi:hypothetical protein
VAGAPADDAAVRDAGPSTSWRNPRRRWIVIAALVAIAAGTILAGPRVVRWFSGSGDPRMEFIVTSEFDREVALVLTDVDTGLLVVGLWISAGGTQRWYLQRPPGRLRVAVVASDLSSGPLTTGACDLVVPASGTARLVLRDDGTATLIPPDPDDWRAPRIVPINESSRHARLTLCADDCTTDRHSWGERAPASSSAATRPWVAGERLHATWELAAPVTSGGRPFELGDPGDVYLQVDISRSGRWEIGTPPLATLLDDLIEGRTGSP